MSGTITITIKCSNNTNASVVIDANETVLALKEKIAESELKVPAANQRLIYKGKVLKDELTLDHYEVQDGHTVHMVKSGAATAAAAATTTSSGTSRATSAPSAAGAGVSFGAMPAPAPASSSAGGGMGAFGMPFAPNTFGAMGNPADFSRIQEQLMQSPEMMQQIMNSPMMQNLMNNPEMFRQMMMSNPQMQAMLDANPQIRHMLNDPAVSSCLSLDLDLLL